LPWHEKWIERLRGIRRLQVCSPKFGCKSENVAE